MRVVVADPLVESVNVVGRKLQLLSDGSVPHIVGDSVTVPLLLNPFNAVSVRIVEPDAPGVPMVIVVGFAEIEKVGAGVTVSAITALEVA